MRKTQHRTDAGQSRGDVRTWRFSGLLLALPLGLALWAGIFAVLHWLGLV